MKLKQQDNGSLSITGGILLSDTVPLREALLNCLATQPGVVLDLSKVDMCHTAAFQTLLACRRSAEESGKAFRITVAPFLRETSEALGLAPSILENGSFTALNEGQADGK